MSAFPPPPSSLTLPGPRELLATSSQVASLLSSLPVDEASMKTLTALTVGDKSYTGEGARAMCEGLVSRCTGVTELDLADIIAGRMEAEGLEVSGLSRM